MVAAMVGQKVARKAVPWAASKAVMLEAKMVGQKAVMKVVRTVEQMAVQMAVQ